MRVPLSDVVPGMRLGGSIVGEKGQVLLPAGAELTEAYIRLLAARGVEWVVVEGQQQRQETAADVLSRRTRQELTAAVKKTMIEIAQSASPASSRLHIPTVAFKIDGLRQAVNQVVTDLLSNPRAIITLQGIREVDEYTMLHSIEVCVLSTMVGNALGMGQNQLNELSLAALLHDIGKIGIPRKIISKPGRLTPEESAIMQRHPVLGWSLLKGQKDLGEEVAMVALQHHERWSGEPGYPLGLSGEQIHPYARICSVADVYDALTGDRVYRKGLAPAEAIEIMTGPMKSAFEPRVLSALLECVAPFPLGLVVQLCDGRVAEVVGVDPTRLDRPRIRLVQGQHGQVAEGAGEIDLAEDPALAIIRRRLPEIEDWQEAMGT